MKKFGQIVLVFLLSVGMFTGCGTSYKADESTVFVLKDGKIVVMKSKIVNHFGWICLNMF